MIKAYLFTHEETKDGVSLGDWQSLTSDGSRLLWVDVRCFSRDELVELAGQFGLHPLALQSVHDPYTRPHVYEFPNHFYVNMTVVRGGGRDGVRRSELHLFVGERFVITVTKGGESEAVDRALDEYRENPSLCMHGSLYAAYLLAEDLIETYFPLVERLDNEADKLENEMLNRADKRALQKLFALKRRAFELRRLLGPQRDAFNELARREFPFVSGEARVYFQDVYNRMIRIFDMLDTIREILSGSLDIYLSTVSNRLNEVMKVLTVAATILMTLALITGFYGMNFSRLPWLNAPHAFRNTLIFMAAVTTLMLWWFRRKKWL